MFKPNSPAQIFCSPDCFDSPEQKRRRSEYKVSWHQNLKTIDPTRHRMQRQKANANSYAKLSAALRVARSLGIEVSDSTVAYAALRQLGIEIKPKEEQ
jgi:hypothetical protein